MCRRFLRQSDDELLSECRVRTCRSSGPGGQHRDKTDSAVTISHGPTGISATASDARSQRENRTIALKRLKMKLAIKHRQPPPEDPASFPIMQEYLVPCSRTPGEHRAGASLHIGRKNPGFWPCAAVILDLLDAECGRLSSTARHLGISTGNLTALLKSERHLHAAANDIRRHHDHRPIS